MKLHWFCRKTSDKVDDPRKEEIASVFACERVGLQKLALLLTADPEAAKRCLICTFRDCMASGSVSKEWILSWARRMVIRNAISLVFVPREGLFINTNGDADQGKIAFSQDDSLAAIAEHESILELPAFDRFVFVICVLERYSMYDCALLLGRSPREIDEARQRVGNREGKISEFNDISLRFMMR